MVVLKLLVLLYALGFFVVLGFHLLILQMVTPELALLRAAVWPVFLATGWPHGTPMRMD